MDISTDAALVTDFTAPGEAVLSPRDVCILIVDDDDTVRILINEFMETVGYHTITAGSGREALSFLKTTSVDVVITDIMMPEMDGLQLTKRIKERCDAEIIVMTGYSGDYSYEEVIHRGASDFVFKPVRFEELLLRLKRVIKERNLRKELASSRQEMEQLAITDDLTRLFNARHFYHQIRAEASRSVRCGRPLSLLIIDIDHFKNYNDTWGHLEGNHVLARLGQIFIHCLRTMDSAYRYGGGEFAIILPDTRAEEAERTAECIRKTVTAESFQPVEGKRIVITVSIGITEYRHRLSPSADSRFPAGKERPAPPPALAASFGDGDLKTAAGETIENFIRRANTALNHSKDTGRNACTRL
ncbi:MAG: diguanylate cyclase response regulator [Desulfobacterales bacterium]|nr:MAG: diguanylate cyclase response regulator [Desulfobacterales bacterium]